MSGERMTVRGRFNAGAGRVVLNTTVSWMRIVGVAFAKLLTIRFLLIAFGAEEFGVFFAVSSVALLTAFLTGAMQTMSLRAISLESARGSDMNPVFNNLLAMHLVAAAMMLIIGGAAGYLSVNYLMEIPANRLSDANTVFVLILSATVVGNVAALYEAFLQSRERFEVFSAIELIQTWILVPVSFWLMYQSDDLIRIYAIFVASLSIAGNVCAAIITRRLYPETRLKIYSQLDLKFIGHHSWIGSWSLVGAISGAIRVQGLVLLFNVLGGPTANAIYAIAGQFPNLVRHFVSTFQLVLASRIYGKEAVGDRNQMIAHVFSACRLASILVLIVTIPVATEVNSILQIWLGDYESLTGTVSLMLLVALILEQLAAGTGLAHLALGRVARFNIIAGGLSILMLPSAYWIGNSTGEILYVLYTLICFTGLVALTKVVLLYPEVKNPISKWISLTVIPVLFFSVPPSIVSFTSIVLFDPSPRRLLLTVVLTVIVGMPSAFFLGFNRSERLKLRQIFSSGDVSQ